MSYIRIDLEATVINGQALTFKSPVDCSQITGLIVYYPEGNSTKSTVFQFADAHGNNVGSINLFAANVLVKVVLDTDLKRAYVQNADTNKYIEDTFLKKAGGTMSGAINMGSKKITNLATPTADADASTKKYVDDNLKNKQDAITGLSNSMVMICDSSGNIRTSSTVSTGDLQALSGIDSNIQTQLDGKEPTITTLPLEKGGTGATTAKGASAKILGDMAETTTALTDVSMLVFKYSNPSSDTGAVFYKKAPLLADYIDEKLKVGEKIPKLTKLWTNAKPTSTFAGQTLSVTLTGYDFIMVRYKIYYTQSTYVCDFIKTSSGGILQTVSQGGKYRGVTITASSNSVAFGSVYNADDTAGTNDYLVPYEIYGCDLL